MNTDKELHEPSEWVKLVNRLLYGERKRNEGKWTFKA